MQLTYYGACGYADDPEIWEAAPDDEHTLRWGYNLADLDRLTRTALSRQWARNVDQRLRYATAWSAIALAIYAAGEPPEPGDLVRAGWEALSAYLTTERRHWGMRYDGSERPSFGLYWDHAVQPAPSPEGAAVERMALWQIWPRLHPDERQTLLALAAHDEYRLAAEALGLKYYTYCARVRRARIHFLRLWHEGETPSHLWGHDNRGQHKCRSGNDTVMGVLRRRKAAAA